MLRLNLSRKLHIDVSQRYLLYQEVYFKSIKIDTFAVGSDAKVLILIDLIDFVVKPNYAIFLMEVT